MCKLVVSTLLFGLMTVPVLAQTSAEVPAAAALPASAAATRNALPDRFQVDTGWFRIDSNTVLWLQNGAGIRSEVNFEDDLGLSPHASTFWVDATWRPGRRHQLKLSFTKLSRESQSKVLSRSFTWNDKEFSAGLSATGSAGTNITSGYYRFSLVRNDRFEIGPAIGVGYLTLTAGISAEGTLVVPGFAPQAVRLDESGSYGHITGDIGAFVNVWASRNAVVRGDFLYIVVKPGETRASVTDSRVAFDYYPWTHVGLGAQYKYNKYSYDQGIRTASLGGNLTYKGAQVYLSFLF